MNQPLEFNEFEPCDIQTWRTLVQKELGDKPFDSLLWKDENGISLYPYFTKVESSDCLLSVIPGNWKIAQTCSFEEDSRWNVSILNALSGGVQFITLDFENHDLSNLSIVLKDVQPEFISIRFINHPNPKKLLIEFHNLIHEWGFNAKVITGSIGVKNPDSQLQKWLCEFCSTNIPLVHVVEVDAVDIHNRGGNTILEIAYALSAGHQQLFELIESGLSLTEANSRILFNVGVGSSYFVEIAKIKVIRQLWDFILSKYDPQISAENKACFIHAETSLRDQVEVDIHNNLLRSTTQCMSAILGGADAINVHAYNAISGKTDQSSLRMARNIQHLLIEESYLDQATNAVEGSYYLAEMQNQLSKKVWELFQKIEGLGGANSASEFINTMLTEINAERNSAIQEGKRVVVGLNKYQPTAKKALS